MSALIAELPCGPEDAAGGLAAGAAAPDERLDACARALGGDGARETLAVLHALGLAMDPVVLVAPDRSILFANAQAAELTGRPVGALLAQCCTEGLGLRTCAAYCALYEEGAVCGRRCELVRPDGEPRWIQKDARLLRAANGAVVGGVERLTDVSEWVGLSRLLEDERALLRSMTARCDEALVVVDALGRIRALTDGAAKLLEVGKGQVHDRLLAEVLGTGGADCPGVAPALPLQVGPSPCRPALKLGWQQVAAEDGRRSGALVRLSCVEEDCGQELAPGLVGRSPALAELASRIRRIASSEATVLITGETGVGKEAVARAIHLCSARKGRPFYAINCGGLTETLLENELFGHERGAFTGAVCAQRGRLEACGDGTLLLDEIGCLSLPMQAKLLRVLEQREFQRVGGTRTLRVEGRILAATNAELEAEVRAGRFRADLFYRLQSIPLVVPPLRRRKEDILPLAHHFLAEAGGAQLTTAAQGALQAYAWPGNVRELRNAVQAAAALASAGVVGVADLPERVRAAYIRGPDGAEDEAARLRRALEQSRYSRVRAAEALGISRATLWRRLRRHGID